FYVTSHLATIAQFFKSSDYKTRNLELPRRDPETYCELDMVVESINTMADVVRRSEQSLLDELETHRASAINSARLASMGEMAGGVAHELNNPLAIVEGYLHMIKVSFEQGEDGISKVPDILEKTENTCQRMVKIVDGLKTYSRNAGGDPLIEISVRELVSDVLIFCKERIISNGIKLDVSGVENDILISCRSTELSQVLVSIINNAFDAVRDADLKWIKVACDIDNDLVKISISDSGPGVPPNLSTRIFNPFFTTKEVGKGTGLGLSISQNIVEAHGGKISLDRSSNNTKFVISLPAVSPSPLIDGRA
ncbi:ATP-binding protein, partial [bacterium]|nr:ATP-binding protein [bacterium]